MHAHAPRSRPWWACALVPPYLVVGWFVLGPGLLALAPIWGFAAVAGYFIVLSAILGWPGCAGTAVLAWIALAITRCSPWRSPAVDALVATALSALVVPMLLLTGMFVFTSR
jgi:hypothetical protein